MRAEELQSIQVEVRPPCPDQKLKEQPAAAVKRLIQRQTARVLHRLARATDSARFTDDGTGKV